MSRHLEDLVTEMLNLDPCWLFTTAPDTLSEETREQVSHALIDLPDMPIPLKVDLRRHLRKEET